MLILLAWAIAVSLSFLGWGVLTLRAMRFPRVSLALAAAFGTGVVVLIGGVLNLGHLLGTSSLRVFVLVGAALFAIELAIRRRETYSAARAGVAIVRERPGLTALATVLCVLTMLVALTSVRRKIFEGDDTAAYLAFTVKTAQLGSIPDDPFSDRRIKSSLGSNYFIKALMMPDGDFRSMGFPDSGFGYLLFVALAYQIGSELLSRRRYGLAAAALAAALPFLRINEQMYLLPAALFLACFLYILQLEGWRLGLVLGVTCAAAATMKSSYLPFVTIMLAVYYLLYAQSRGWPRIGSGLAAASLSFLVVILPWMADSKLKNGTLFYPLLGDGFHATAYLSRFPELKMRSATLLTLASFAPFTAVLLVLALLILLDRELDRRSENTTIAVGAFLSAAAISTAAVGYATAGESVGRYSLPFIYPATLLALILFFRRWLQHGRRTPATKIGLGLTVVWTLSLMTYYGAIQKWGDYREYPAEIMSMFSDHVTPPMPRPVFTGAALKRIFQSAQAWQSRVPAGEPIYAASIESEGIDFQRNSVYIADSPGLASLPPGMPFKDPELLRAYFKANHLRYVVFPESFDDQARLKINLAYRGRRVMMNRESIASCETRITLKKLRDSSTVMYDDGALCLMRLY